MADATLELPHEFAYGDKTIRVIESSDKSQNDDDFTTYRVLDVVTNDEGVEVPVQLTQAVIENPEDSADLESKITGILDGLLA